MCNLLTSTFWFYKTTFTCIIVLLLAYQREACWHIVMSSVSGSEGPQKIVKDKKIIGLEMIFEISNIKPTDIYSSIDPMLLYINIQPAMFQAARYVSVIFLHQKHVSLTFMKALPTINRQKILLC